MLKYISELANFIFTGFKIHVTWVAKNIFTGFRINVINII